MDVKSVRSCFARASVRHRMQSSVCKLHLLKGSTDRAASARGATVGERRRVDFRTQHVGLQDDKIISPRRDLAIRHPAVPNGSAFAIDVFTRGGYPTFTKRFQRQGGLCPRSNCGGAAEGGFSNSTRSALEWRDRFSSSRSSDASPSRRERLCFRDRRFF